MAVLIFKEYVMIKVLNVVTGDYMENCYIVYNSDTKGGVIIDPGDDADLILNTINDNGIKVEAILLTHGHFDHIGAVNSIKTKLGVKVYMNSDDSELLTYQRKYDFTPDEDIKNVDELAFDGFSFKVLHIPGHTKGSVGLLCNGMFFSGDTLFKESIGRCDLPGGSMFKMTHSLKSVILNLDDNIIVYPGHGEKTYMGFEKTNNIYLEKIAKNI